MSSSVTPKNIFSKTGRSELLAAGGAFGGSRGRDVNDFAGQGNTVPLYVTSSYFPAISTSSSSKTVPPIVPLSAAALPRSAPNVASVHSLP